MARTTSRKYRGASRNASQKFPIESVTIKKNQELNLEKVRGENYTLDMSHKPMSLAIFLNNVHYINCAPWLKTLVVVNAWQFHEGPRKVPGSEHCAFLSH